MGEVISIYQPEPEHLQSVDGLVDRTEIEMTARTLLHNREQLPFVETRAPERHDNARTAIMEALTASGHLSRVEISGRLEDINRQVLTRLVNGYDERLPLRERQRRFYELCNELIIQRLHTAIAQGTVKPTMAVTEISDYFINQPDEVANRLGYRARNKKGMVRSTHLRQNADGSYTRIIEQVSRSNATPETTFALLHGAGLYPQGDESPDVLALKTPLLYDTDVVIDGVVSIQRRLDKYAGPAYRYGEQSNKLHVPYEELRQESARREAAIAPYVERLVSFETSLERAKLQRGLSESECQSQYAEELRQILRAICIVDPDYVKDCFGERATEFYERAALFSAKGDNESAMRELVSAAGYEDTVVICGMAIDPERAEQFGIAIDSIGKLVEAGKDSWKWKAGSCRVKNCESPKPTLIGPCSVCKNCQRAFDKGQDPTKYKAVAAVIAQKAVAARTLWRDKRLAHAA